MDDRITRLESTVEELRVSLRTLEARLAAIETQAGAVPAPALEAQAASDMAAAEAADTGASRGWRDPVAVLSLLGRLVLVLAGGFFLRAMTDNHVLPPQVGVALGFAYGLVWLAAADRAGGRQQAPSAFFHAMAAALVAFPLLIEATTRFKVLSGGEAAAVLTDLAAGLLFVASRRRLRPVAWVAALATLPTALVLMAQTGAYVPFAFHLIGFGVAALWIGYSLDWLVVRWPAALIADMVVFGVTMRALSPESQETPGVAMVVQLTLLGAYLVSIAIRTLVRGRNVIPFEVVQTMAALIVGFGGAVSVTRATGTAPTALGLASLVLGAACYAVAFAFIDRSDHRGRNVYFYTTLGFVLVLTGFTLVLTGHVLGIVLAVLAVTACALWSRVGRLFMLLHGAAYLSAAAVVSGTLVYCAWALADGSVSLWERPAAVMLAVMAMGAVAAFLASSHPESDGSPYASGPRFVIILVFVWIAGGCLIGYLAPLLSVAMDRPVDLGSLATIRTVVLAVATLVVAWIGRHARFREWGWLAYPLLVGIGLKMAAHDFMHSRPATMFVAMAFYGAALILAPRLRRGGDNAPAS